MWTKALAAALSFSTVLSSTQLSRSVPAFTPAALQVARESAGRLREGVSLLEPIEYALRGLIHWEGLVEALGSEEADVPAPNGGLVLGIAEALRAENPRIRWPPELQDVSEYFTQKPRGLYAVRDASVIAEVDSVRLRALSKLCWSVSREEGQIIILSSLPILLKKVGNPNE